MGQQTKIDALLEEYPSLRQVLDWWSDPLRESEHLEGLRQEILRLRRSWKRVDAVWKSAMGLLGGEGTAPDQDNLKKLDPSLHRLLWNFALADEIADRYGKIQRKNSRRVLIFIALFGTGFWFLRYASQLLPDKPFHFQALPLLNNVMAGSVVAVLLIVIAGLASLRGRGRYRQNRDRFLISRTLAETLRVDLAQKLAGTGLDTVQEFSRQYDRSHDISFSELVLKSALKCAGAPPSSPPSDGLEQARTLWLEEQSHYFGDPILTEPKPGEKPPRILAERLQRQKAERRLKAAVRLVIGSLALSLIFRGIQHGQLIPVEWHPGLQLGAIISELCTALFGLWAGYSHQVAALHAVTAQKYHRAKIFLTDALEELKKDLPPSERRAIFTRLGKQALAESADWGVHQREHTPRAAFR